MKKSIVKKLMITAVLSSLLVMNGTISVFGASSVSTSMGGVTVSGNISKDTTSATAKTSCPRPASISANATVYYWFDSNYYQTSNYSSVSGGTTVTTAVKKRGGADVVGGKGIHYVGFDSSSWKPTTTIGVIPSSAIPE